MPNIGMQELLIILLIAVIFFGGKKIPEIGKGIGEGIRQRSEERRVGKECRL